jgi:hypothetical protein
MCADVKMAMHDVNVLDLLPIETGAFYIAAAIRVAS